MSPLGAPGGLFLLLLDIERRQALLGPGSLVDVRTRASIQASRSVWRYLTQFEEIRIWTGPPPVTRHF